MSWLDPELWKSVLVLMDILFIQSGLIWIIVPFYVLWTYIMVRDYRQKKRRSKPFKLR